MWTYLSSVYNYLFPKSTDSKNDNEREEYLAEQLLELELAHSDDVYKIVEEEEEMHMDKCVQRTGIVTYIGEDYVLIDGMLYFNTISCKIKVNLGDNVSYLGYYKTKDEVKVVRLLDNYGAPWGEEDYVAEEHKFDVIDHVMVREVSHRQGRHVYMADEQLSFSLDEVEGRFVPMQGDWLELKCEIQWDPEKPFEISAAKVVKVLAFNALRTKCKAAVISEWTAEGGVCDNCIFFDKYSLQEGTQPQIGLKVMVEAIESNQGACTWRAIRIVPDDKQVVVQQNGMESLEEGESLQNEELKQIQMTHPLKFENVFLNQPKTLYLNITNKSRQPYTLLKWIVCSKKRDSQVFIEPFINRPETINPDQSFSLKIKCCPKFLGITKELIVVVFRGFQLKRYVHINVINDICNEDLSDVRYSRKTNDNLVLSMRNIRHRHRTYVPGVRTRRVPNFVPVRLGIFTIPEKIWTAMLGDSRSAEIETSYLSVLCRIENHLPYLTADLNIHNYTDRWHALLYIEEVQQNIFMRAFDIPHTYLDQRGEFLSLHVAGLSEKRPSLMPGDTVHVLDVHDQAGHEYQGYIHAVRDNDLLLKFNPNFHERYTGSDVSVEFRFNRSVFRRGHQAINLALSHLGHDLLFPSRVRCRPPRLALELLANMKWFNKNLNDGQKAAVKGVLAAECRPLPYCIYGPPGTGKTITVIEIILQILSLLPDSRILVATPSNSAANLIAERLLEYRSVFSDSMVRLIAHYLVDSENIPAAIKPYCSTLDIAKENTAPSRHEMNKDGVNLYCGATFMGRHRVTIGTCYSIGSLAQLGLPKGHFTHVIVDEAAQATEPEILIPMCFTDKENGQIILAGDPMQLGPVVISKFALDLGFGETYMSRILDRFPYQKDFHSFKDGYDNRLVTKLNDNYRSLHEVLSVPSKLFYDNTLVPQIDRSQEWIQNICKVVSQNLFSMQESSGGIFVYGIKGCNKRAESSPSWYNSQEASMLALTTCKLYKLGIDVEDIGVISPYVAQIKHLRLIFDAMGLAKPKIGSVEEFQGQERPVVLISTVRSEEAHLEDDLKHSLGFVKSPKRLNVALTRAQVAVLLFCDPHLLYKDFLWRAVLSQAVTEDKYMGCDLPSELEKLRENK